MSHPWSWSQGAEKSWEGLGSRSSQGGTIPSKLVLQIKVGNILSKNVPICLTIIFQKIPWLFQRSRKIQICVVGMYRNWRRKGDSRPGLAGAQCCKNQAYFNFFSPFLPTPASHETILKQSLTFVLCSTAQCPTMPAMQCRGFPNQRR